MRSNTLLIVMILGLACSAEAVPTAFQLDDFHDATFASLGLVAEPVAADGLLIRDEDGAVLGEAWTHMEGHAELTWRSTHVTVVNEADRTTATCNDVAFIMVRNVTGEWVPEASTPVFTLAAECYEPITVARIVASAARPMVEQESLAAETDEAGATQALCSGGTCYDSWGLSADSACASARAACVKGGESGDLFCTKQGNAHCGSLYCTCTYCDPCQQHDVVAEGDLEY